MESVSEVPSVTEAQSQARMAWKLGGYQRAKNRSQYHELELSKKLVKYGWRRGRRIPASGPMLGWCDLISSKEQNGVHHLGFFQLKPWMKTKIGYFSGVQLLSLLMLDASFGSRDNSVMEKYRSHTVLVAKLKGRVTVWHRIIPEDLVKVGLLDDILSRINLENPTDSMKILKDIPSPQERAAGYGGVKLTNYYDYIKHRYLPVNSRDDSNWNPANP